MLGDLGEERFTNIDEWVPKTFGPVYRKEILDKLLRREIEYIIWLTENMEKIVSEDPRGHTLVPVNIGTSVFGIKYKDGVLLAADTAVSYGSMKKSKKSSRMTELSKESALACSGEMADFQELQKMLKEKREADEIEADGATFLKPKDYFNYLSRV